MWFCKRRKADEAALLFLTQKPIRYAARRGANGEETILGREGFINRHEGRIVISCGHTIVLDRPTDELQIGELLSKNGAVFTFFEVETGEKVTIVAYYTHY